MKINLIIYQIMLAHQINSIDLFAVASKPVKVIKQIACNNFQGRM